MSGAVTEVLSVRGALPLATGADVSRVIGAIARASGGATRVENPWAATAGSRRRPYAGAPLGPLN